MYRNRSELEDKSRNECAGPNRANKTPRDALRAAGWLVAAWFAATSCLLGQNNNEGEYGVSRKFGWVNDRYCVSWPLDFA
jgi:hypothetical protein